MLVSHMSSNYLPPNPSNINEVHKLIDMKNIVITK